MNHCKCAKFWDEPGVKWYPRRLLDLQELRANPQDPQRARVRLVESKECLGQPEKRSIFHHAPAKRQNDRYVTLSHCWGKPGPNLPPPLKLTFETEKRFKNEGIRLHELPKTFRDAVMFAARLDRVGFIWIDSLCIRQPILKEGRNKAEEERDWFEQSRHMGAVYQKAFLNISATASKDGQGGLFFNERPAHLWENNVYVYCPEERPSVSKNGPPERDVYAKCSLIDTSTWDDLVEYAPVNQRAWVFQERLLAPRVLHFGYNQLAWECREFNMSESHTSNELGIKPSRTNGFIQDARLKHLTPAMGRSLREARLSGMSDPDQHIRDLYIYELWKKTVESYSQTALTQHKDRLIALGGIAKLFQEDLFGVDCRQIYVAGLWSRYIESQLLWQVNDVYNGNGLYDNPGKRHSEGGPSWSWAAIESPHGITYGDVTDFKTPQSGQARPRDELLFKVVDYKISLADPKNPFGMVTAGRIFLAPRHLHRIELRKQSPSHGVPYIWHLKPPVQQTKRPIEYENSYLDAPDSDADVFAPTAELYCMPAAFGMRTVRSSDRYLYCLLLKCEGRVSVPPNTPGKQGSVYRVFRRVGITQVGSMFRGEQEALLKQGMTQEVSCLC